MLDSYSLSVFIQRKSTTKKKLKDSLFFPNKQLYRKTKSKMQIRKLCVCAIATAYVLDKPGVDARITKSEAGHVAGAGGGGGAGRETAGLTPEEKLKLVEEKYKKWRDGGVEGVEPKPGLEGLNLPYEKIKAMSNFLKTRSEKTVN